MIDRPIYDKIFSTATEKNREKFFIPIRETYNRFQINSPLRISACSANLIHESGSFFYVKELASGSAYDTGKLSVALGNTPEEDGDGQKYKGRGLIQITGTNNYRELGKALAIDLLKNPSLLEQPEYAALSAGWFWGKRCLNAYADREDFLSIVKRINGGYNGLEDRVKHYNRIRGIYGLSEWKVPQR